MPYKKLDTFGVIIIIIIFVDYVMLSLFRPLEEQENSNGQKSGTDLGNSKY
jgi:hypothetical protein